MGQQQQQHQLWAAGPQVPMTDATSSYPYPPHMQPAWHQVPFGFSQQQPFFLVQPSQQPGFVPGGVSMHAMQPQQPAGWVPQNGMSMSMPYPQLQLSQQQQQLSQHQQRQLPASQQQQYQQQQQQQQQLPMYGQDQSCGQAKPSKKKKKKTRQQQQQQQQQHNGMQETQTVPGDGDTSSSHTNAMGMTSRALSLAGSEHACPSQAFQQLLGLQGFSPSQLMMQQHPHGMPPHPLQQNAPATSHAQQQQQQLQLMQSPSLQLQQQPSSQGQQQELLRQQLMQRLVSQAHMLSQLPSGKPPAPNTDSRKDRKPRPECPVCGGPG